MSRRTSNNRGSVPTRITKAAKRQIERQKNNDDNGNGRVTDPQTIEKWRQFWNKAHKSTEQEIQLLITDVKTEVNRIMERHNVDDECRHLINQQLQISLMLLSDAAEGHVDPERMVQKISKIRQQYSSHPEMQAARELRSEADKKTEEIEKGKQEAQ